jgi:hypothetical protein
MEMTKAEERRLEREANRLAKLASLGDSDAKAALRDLISNNTYVAQLVRKLKRKIEIKRAKKSRKREKDNQLKGSVMIGLSGKTGSRPWKNTK